MSFRRVTRKIVNGKIVSELIEEIDGDVVNQDCTDSFWRTMDKAWKTVDEAFEKFERGIDKMFSDGGGRGEE